MKIAARHRARAAARGSFGFFYPNIILIPSNEGEAFTSLRINPGLNPEDNKFIIEFFNELLKAAAEIDQPIKPLPAESSASTSIVAQTDEKIKQAESSASTSIVAQSASSAATSAVPKISMDESSIAPVPGDGNCAATALIQQFQKLRPLQFSQMNASILRTQASDYLINQATKLAEDSVFVGYVAVAIPALSITPSPEIQAILHNLSAYTDEEKIKLIKWYAEQIKKEGVWLDIPFFVAASKMYDIPVAIIKQDSMKINDSAYKIAERFPTDTSFNIRECAIIYYNGTDHYQGVVRNDDFLKELVDKDAGIRKLEKPSRNPQILF